MPILLKRPLLLLPLSVLLSLIYWSYLLKQRHERLGTWDILGPASLSCPNLSRGDSSALLPLDSRPRNHYVLFSPDSPTPEPSLLPLTALPQSCLSPWLTHGLPCPSSPPPKSRFTVLYTWVNGSDPLQYAAALAHAEEVGTPKARVKGVVGGKWYREHEELRYSMRSVLASLGSSVDGIRLVTMDYRLPCSGSGSALSRTDPQAVRAAQIPQWLDMAQRRATGEWVDERTGVELRVVPHWEVGVREEVFNSFAIEAGLGNLQEGVGENLIYMNDDYFLLHPLTPSTFHSAYYGPVFRMQTDLLIQSRENGKANPSGEWAALEWSGWLLDERFGARQRPYVIHVSKSLSRPLLAELSLLFSLPFSETRTHAFRSQHDAYTTFLFPHFVIERHREALLWSFVVGRIGGSGGAWGEEEMERAWRVLGGEEEEEFYVDLVVPKGVRRTLEEGRVAGVLGEEPGSTVYRFSSHDGYPYTSPQKPSRTWPSFPLPGTTAPQETCTLEFELCLGTDGEVSSTASAVFARVAFAVPRCGDCLVQALITASGDLGLSAFLPPPPADPASARPLPETYVPHLPLTATHANTSFALSSILPYPPGEVDMHAFALALIARYTYVLADTPVRFVSLRSPATARTLLRAIDKLDGASGGGGGGGGGKEGGVAMVCLNDDIVSKEQEVGRVVREWMGGRWGREAGWEEGRGWW